MWVPIPAVPLSGCVALGRCLKCPEPQFTYLSDGNNERMAHGAIVRIKDRQWETFLWHMGLFITHLLRLNLLPWNCPCIGTQPDGLTPSSHAVLFPATVTLYVLFPLPGQGIPPPPPGQPNPHSSLKGGTSSRAFLSSQAEQNPPFSWWPKLSTLERF